MNGMHLPRSFQVPQEDPSIPASTELKDEEKEKKKEKKKNRSVTVLKSLSCYFISALRLSLFLAFSKQKRAR